MVLLTDSLDISEGLLSCPNSIRPLAPLRLSMPEESSLQPGEVIDTALTIHASDTGVLGIRYMLVFREVRPEALSRLLTD